MKDRTQGPRHTWPEADLTRSNSTWTPSRLGVPHPPVWGVGGTVDRESALRSAGPLLSRVRAPLWTPLPDGRPESLRSP
ncbi:hypothetical protein PoB_007147000 [Plakobranchus ocellatus]|uniref:Uncharacterized protein n=1 Tax=Plakobranchus ocellatus TaxID=259542 RepID=A0AAV4DLD1_9GAST|nr:hypothetical protein PoB_007147000 [Plakobranchus ocellatus]